LKSVAFVEASLIARSRSSRDEIVGSLEDTDGPLPPFDLPFPLPIA
jgi:hypothetical protein